MLQLKNAAKIFGLILCLLILPTNCSANSVLPWFFEVFPELEAIFWGIPLVLVAGTIIIKKNLRQTYQKSFVASLVANIITVAFGFCLLPLYRSIGLRINDYFLNNIYLFSHAPFDILYYGWMIVYAIINFFVTLAIYYLFFKLFFTQSNKNDLKKTVWLSVLVPSALIVLLQVLFYCFYYYN